MMGGIGIVLDLVNRAHIAGGGSSDVFALWSFRIALIVRYLVVGTGVVFLLRARRQTRRQLSEGEGISVTPLWVVLVTRMLRT